MQYKNISLILIGIIILATIVGSVQQKSNEYVLLSFSYDNGNFALINKSLETGSYPYSAVERDYTINLVSSSNLSLYSASFDPSLLYTDGGSEQLEGGLVSLNQAVFYAVLPNFENLKNVQIIKDNQVIFE